MHLNKIKGPHLKKNIAKVSIHIHKHSQMEMHNHIKRSKQNIHKKHKAIYTHNHLDRYEKVQNNKTHN